MAKRYDPARATMILKRRTYRNYSGIVAYSRESAVTLADFGLVPGDGSRHMPRAVYLAALLEGPFWGTVQSYDGCGMSAGVFHWIGRRRNGQQGSLFPLLRRMELSRDPLAQQAYQEISDGFASEGWYVSTDGRLRRSKTGALVSGTAFRNVVAPPGGKVPSKGAARTQAEIWASAFCRLFTRGADAQVDHAIDWLVRGHSVMELEAYRVGTGRGIVSVEPVASSDIGPELDLAMSVYHSHSVNAPAPAASCLRAALKTAHDDRVVLAEHLVRALAKRRYGAWKKRYTRTRYRARTSGLWDEELFTGPKAVMPARFS